ncbi:hypothetical protein NWP22_01475 [Anabaenopsis tanganyikae CS-531]|uniref:DUF2357 domain-containing protein n=2 Tax=Anabaenopsis TaxID=110103 RepID=A0ABT5AQ67_9CYAN|nr:MULTISPECIES: hypothetical protein [Anabaenopsis]MDB9539460.1 hypothetical protein [Anabaenopsis arnoldii]MDH6091765.1 hypothetical protein [Anabaenopsis arnoldii]MDH6104565.1 hypothetical protein [Anabaenopsis tanganyikae CS-531]
MMLGKIDWFGGVNRNNIQVNFGYITPLGEENTRGIRVERYDVPLDIQEIIEGNRGKGVYVQFDTDSRRNRAINLKVRTFIGVIKRSEFGGTWQIIYDDNCQINYSRNTYYQSGSLVAFNIKETKDKEAMEMAEILGEEQEIRYKLVPFLLRTINDVREVDNDEGIVEKYANSNIFPIFKNFIIEYLLSLPLETAENFVVNKLQYADDIQKKFIISEIAVKLPNILIISSTLRSYLRLDSSGANSYILFINKYINLVEEDVRQKLIDELITKIEQANERERQIYWDQVQYLQENLAYKNFLWHIAPIERKRTIIRNRFQKLLNMISRFKESDYPYKRYISHNWNQLYQLNELDRLLITQWDSSVDYNNHTAGKMISARGAEKLVIQFYQALGYQVEDISIHQVNSQSQDWRLGDIRLDSEYLLDVKNSRKSFNSDSYSEFCVPQFKESRLNDVKIVGVLSPYLQQRYMGGTEKPNFNVQDPQVLGSFDRTKLTELEQIFNDRLISINMPRGSDTNKYLPPWLFDYDERFYREQYTILTELQNLHYQDIPTWEEVSSVAQNFLPLFIAAKRQLPRSWVDNLPQWQVEFINRLINLPTKRTTLPYLFLSILTHFLSMLSYQAGDYSPQAYLKLIYTSDTDRSNPLKLYDPLHIIKDFCDTLTILWDNRQSSQINEFKIFKFSGQGLLQGKRSELDNLTTILAYCGGWIDGKGKCGYRPLVIGKEKNCRECGRLICRKDNCGFCSHGCSAMSLRVERLRTERLRNSAASRSQLLWDEI